MIGCRHFKSSQVVLSTMSVCCRSHQAACCCFWQEYFWHACANCQICNTEGRPSFTNKRDTDMLAFAGCHSVDGGGQACLQLCRVPQTSEDACFGHARHGSQAWRQSGHNGLEQSSPPGSMVNLMPWLLASRSLVIGMNIARNVKCTHSSTLMSETVSVPWHACLLDESQSYRDVFLGKISICSPESVPLWQNFPLQECSHWQ